MIIKDYIETGILEKYALGLTTEAENLEIQNHINNFPEIKAELFEIQNALNEYVLKYQKTPPTDLKNKIWESINAESSESNFAASTLSSKIINLNKTNNLNKWLAAASILLLLGSSVLNIFFYNKYKSTQTKLALLSKEKDFIAEGFKTQSTILEKNKSDLLFLTQPVTKTISLKGVPNFANALATVYWNNETSEVYLVANNLPKPTIGKQYQLWAIVDGKPVDAGMVEINNQNILKMKSFSKPQAFAITLEPAGGSPAPHLEAMYVIGNV